MRECPGCKLCFPDDVQRCPNDGDATFHSISGEPTLDGRYQLVKRLGQGGMGVVYRARHSYLKTNHAIKVILPDLVGNDPMLVTRFRQEALAAAAIRHRNIVNVTDFGVAQSTMPFLVMEFVEGESLHDLLLREKRLSPTLALEILSAICSGLGAAHKQGIVHRDLKPLNVMIQRGQPLEEAVKILDFGLAKIKSGELLGSFIQAQTTGLMGSPYYMAPEQWSDEDPEAAADVYSVGVMLHQMLSGEVPFRGSSIPAIMKKHLYDAPPPLSQAGSDLSPEIERAVAHALEKDRALRTPTVEALVKEFRAAVMQTNVAANLNTVPNVPPHQTASPAAGAQNQLTATLRILSVPPQSEVFLDNKFLGKTEANGWLIVEGVRRGRHVLRVTSQDFAVWESEINCDDDDFQIVAQLQSLLATNIAPAKAQTPNVGAEHGKQHLNKPADNSAAAPPSADLSMPLADSGGDLGLTQAGGLPLGLKSYPEVRPDPKPESKRETAPEINLNPGSERAAAPPAKHGFAAETANKKTDQVGQSSKIRIELPQNNIEVQAKPKSSLLPLLAAFIVALLLVVGGGYAVYRMFFAPTVAQDDPGAGQTTAPTPTPRPTLASVKAEMVEIPGGSFKMGRNSGGLPQEGPERTISVKPFLMDKTEVTNQAYAEFVAAENYPAPSDWSGGAPPAGAESKPVGNVSALDAEAFAKWRSKRDGVEYRLPTEEEWEYAARNGSRSTLFPWGDKWEEGKAIVKSAKNEIIDTKNVGSLPAGANQWGVHDLIGNIREWTASTASFYQGNVRDVPPEYKMHRILRGGSAVAESAGENAITATSRDWFAPNAKNQFFGFRLVRSGS